LERLGLSGGIKFRIRNNRGVIQKSFLLERSVKVFISCEFRKIKEYFDIIKVGGSDVFKNSVVSISPNCVPRNGSVVSDFFPDESPLYLDRSSLGSVHEL
jgi:hypothetical protein